MRIVAPGRSEDMSAITKIVIWGAGGHARVVADILRCQGGFEIAGFLDDSHAERRGQPFCDSVILGGQEQFATLRDRGITAMILAFGDNAARLKLAEIVAAHGFSLATAIHPRATVARGVTVGAGTAIAAGAIVNPAARIGANAIVNTAAGVDHECVIEDGVHISPGARLGGAVTVGRGAWIGMGASVLPKVKIGANAIVGAGAVVLEDVPANVVAYGVPARIVRII
jgi:sugar O-acyltransferase (sialic acid O-acetyltransferase NeuD family)